MKVSYLQRWMRMRRLRADNATAIASTRVMRSLRPLVIGAEPVWFELLDDFGGEWIPHSKKD